MKLIQKLQAVVAVSATNALLAGNVVAQNVVGNDKATNCAFNNNQLGSAFFESALRFLGSPVFYLVMFLLALGGLYAAIVKQDTAGWWAVGFAAIGAATPQVFATIINFTCGVLGGSGS
jgi:hypothetical protein